MERSVRKFGAWFARGARGVVSERVFRRRRELPPPEELLTEQDRRRVVEAEAESARQRSIVGSRSAFEATPRHRREN